MKRKQKSNRRHFIRRQIADGISRRKCYRRFGTSSNHPSTVCCRTAKCAPSTLLSPFGRLVEWSNRRKCAFAQQKQKRATFDQEIRLRRVNEHTKRITIYHPLFVDRIKCFTTLLMAIFNFFSAWLLSLHFSFAHYRIDR